MEGDAGRCNCWDNEFHKEKPLALKAFALILFPDVLFRTTSLVVRREQGV